jgi:hypothetical protein
MSILKLNIPSQKHVYEPTGLSYLRLLRFVVACQSHGDSEKGTLLEDEHRYQGLVRWQMRVAWYFWK